MSRFSVRVDDENPVHTRLTVFNRGGNSGTLTVGKEDTTDIIRRIEGQQVPGGVACEKCGSSAVTFEWQAHTVNPFGDLKKPVTFAQPVWECASGEHPEVLVRWTSRDADTIRALHIHAALHEQARSKARQAFKNFMADNEIMDVADGGAEHWTHGTHTMVLDSLAQACGFVDANGALDEIESDANHRDLMDVMAVAEED